MLSHAVGFVFGSAVLVLALAALLGPSPAAGALPSTVGFATQHQWTHAPTSGNPSPNELRILNDEDAALSAAGAEIFRTTIPWASIERENNSYHRPAVNRLNAIMSRAEAHGLSVDLVVTRTPCWASSTPLKLLGRCDLDRDYYRYPPEHPQHFGDFIEYLSNRYGPGGTYSQGDVLAAIEVWNEPNWGGISLKGPGIVGADIPAIQKEYRKMVRQSRLQVTNGVAVWAGSLHHSGRSKDRDDSADGDPTSGPAWTDALLDLGIANNVDAWSVHTYTPQTSCALPGKVDIYRRIFQSHGEPTIPFAVTEFGWRTEGGDDPSTEAEQSAFLVDGFQRLGEPTASNTVTHALGFRLRDLGPLDTEFSTGYGVLNENFSEKEAYSDLQDLFTGVSAPPLIDPCP